jgi:hypothetical protein
LDRIGKGLKIKKIGKKNLAGNKNSYTFAAPKN